VHLIHEEADMSKQRESLNQYSGRLLPAQAEAGIRAAIENARALLADAELLLANERWSRAAALAILAIEECGKVEIIRSLLLARTDEEVKLNWKAYRTHRRKNVQWISLDLVQRGARTLEDFGEVVNPNSDHGNVAEMVKQVALYTDCCGNAHWSEPAKVIDSDFARHLVKIATALVPSAESAMSTAPELELWIKHLRPVWKGDLASMKAAILDCYAEAKAIGVLKGSQDIDGFARFILGSASSQTIQ
jgi:AbiV family abortive infection protein